MNRGEELTDLRWVRHELDLLNHARMLAALRPQDEEYYEELCLIERELLVMVPGNERLHLGRLLLT